MKSLLSPLAGLLCLGLLGSPGTAAEKTAREIVPSECLVLRPVGRYGRSPVHRDAVEAAIVAGKWQPPRAGDTVQLPDESKQTWEALKLGKDGSFQHEALAGGYAYVAVTMGDDETRILEASGHGMVYVNDEPRVGDLYQTGYVQLPVRLNKGINHLLFHGARGSLRVKLTEPRAHQYLNVADTTLPDLIVGEETQTWGAVLLANATTETTGKLTLQASCAGAEPVATTVPGLLPLSVRKVGFRLTGPAPKANGACDVEVKLVDEQRGPPQVLDTVSMPLRIRTPAESRKRTFRSALDGSVQYYAVLPAQPTAHDGTRPALILTLHGAGVEALGHVDSYAPKSWGHLVAPTNRRPFGFDWEDWGRLDALEVLELARKELRTDPQRTYLTGHSMGGHGTWHLGLTYPDHFAAIGPSAGWISMWSFSGAGRPKGLTTVQDVFLRAEAPSDTLALERNSSSYGVYILHGDKDDNVPVDQARRMYEHLNKFHHDVEYHEHPGAKHWWSEGDEPGVACVDWPPLFDFFGRHTIPALDAVRQVDFTTLNPGVSAWSYWVGIEAQQYAGQPSTVSIRHDPWQRRFRGTTDNVARMALDLRQVRPGEPLQVELDGQKLPEISWPARGERLWLTRDRDRWAVTPEPSAALKGPHRSGPFKEAFRNHVIFVYGTHGTTEENAWALAKARFDAEMFWYRGNGSVDVVADTVFDPLEERERNVIVYGNADTNWAWSILVRAVPVQVRRGEVWVGDLEDTGDDLACLFVRPRPGSERALVGVVAGTGLPGMRLSDRLPYFVSGVGYPDYCVLGPEVLSQGADGVRLAGFFGTDWGVASGNFVAKRWLRRLLLPGFRNGL